MVEKGRGGIGGEEQLERGMDRGPRVLQLYTKKKTCVNIKSKLFPLSRIKHINYQFVYTIKYMCYRNMQLKSNRSTLFFYTLLAGVQCVTKKNSNALVQIYLVKLVVQIEIRRWADSTIFSLLLLLRSWFSSHQPSLRKYGFQGKISSSSAALPILSHTPTDCPP